MKRVVRNDVDLPPRPWGAFCHSGGHKSTAFTDRVPPCFHESSIVNLAIDICCSPPSLHVNCHGKHCVILIAIQKPASYMLDGFKGV